MKKTLFVLCFLLLIPALFLYAGSGGEEEAPKEEEVMAEEAPTPEKIQANVDKLVDKMLAGYPPEAASK